MSQREDTPAFSSQFDGMSSDLPGCPEIFSHSFDWDGSGRSCVGIWRIRHYKHPTASATLPACYYWKFPRSFADFLLRGGSCRRQPRQEREAMDCPAARLDALDDGSSVFRIRYDIPNDGSLASNF